MLGDVIAVEARAVVGLGEPQPVGVELAERHARVVDVVEDAEFHEPASPRVIPGRGHLPANPESIITDWKGCWKPWSLYSGAGTVEGSTEFIARISG